MTTSTNRPRILVTNDDGYDAPGIRVLAEAAVTCADVIIVAPDREQSAASHAITLNRPLRATRTHDGNYRVDGTPADCVHLALDRFTGGVAPDLVLSGINRGLNVGDDVVYSGTVAGALEGTLLHIPSIAFSAALDPAREIDYDSARSFVTTLVGEVLRRGLPAGVLLNVNFPAQAPRGVRITRQGTRTYRATAEERNDPSGQPYYWIAGADMTPTDEADGDHRAIRDGYISVTPLHADMTHRATMESLAAWDLGVESRGHA
ncbi:MAG: 5'/3'-nucleotidase SurE [bacterium]|nr:5'/3'-nucleotidase SurE [bacterium]